MDGFQVMCVYCQWVLCVDLDVSCVTFVNPPNLFRPNIFFILSTNTYISTTAFLERLGCKGILTVYSPFTSYIKRRHLSRSIRAKN